MYNAQTMHQPPRVLIVDDHESIREPLSQYLSRFNFAAEAVADGEEMRARLKEHCFDLVILDIMLPGESGLALCSYLTRQLEIPVILLTAVADPADRIVGLEMGADDYLVKPFEPRELVARMRSVLRRVPPKTRPAQETVPEKVAATPCFSFEGWTFDVASRELLDQAEHRVSISTAEFHLLKAFVENANRVLSRTQLLDLTQKVELASFDRSIDSQISRLRKKLEDNPRDPRLLKTVRGDGYMFAAKVSLSAA